MSEAQKQTSVSHKTGLDAAAGKFNLKTIQALLQETIRLADEARIKGDEDQAVALEEQVELIFNQITDEATARAQADEALDNRLTQHINTQNVRNVYVDEQLQIAKGLNEGERTAVMKLIEDGMADVVNSGKLVQIAARLTVILNGVAVTVPDAIGVLWSKPDLQSTEILTRYDDGLTKSTKLVFTDGLTATTTSTRDESVEGEITITYTVPDFRGLGIDAVATDIVALDADGLMEPKQYGDLVFTLTAPEGTAIVPTNTDFDGDGVVSEGSDTVPADDGGDLGAPG